MSEKTKPNGHLEVEMLGNSSPEIVTMNMLEKVMLHMTAYLSAPGSLNNDEVTRIAKWFGDRYNWNDEYDVPHGTKMKGESDG